MKWLLTFCLLLAVRNGFCQPEDPASLASQLTVSCRTDEEKVKAIFDWITQNISYKTKPKYKTGIKTAALLQYTTEAEDDGPLKSLNVRIAETVLKNRAALCEGYSRLFKVLCDYVGLRAELITGYATNNTNKPVARFGVNHYWNAVFFNDDWHLLDATWASGYVTNETNEFVREYDAHYFLASPEEFIKDHYPDDLRWTLLPESTMPREFRYSPFRQKSFSKYSITSFYPRVGLLDVSPGDTIHFEIETVDARRDLQISPDLSIDSTIFSSSPASVFLKPVLPDPLRKGVNRLSYTYTVTTTNTEWLYLLYNDDLILRYKIRMKKELAKN